MSEGIEFWVKVLASSAEKARDGKAPEKAVRVAARKLLEQVAGEYYGFRVVLYPPGKAVEE